MYIHSTFLHSNVYIPCFYIVEHVDTHTHTYIHTYYICIYTLCIYIYIIYVYTITYVEALHYQLRLRTIMSLSILSNILTSNKNFWSGGRRSWGSHHWEPNFDDLTTNMVEVNQGFLIGLTELARVMSVMLWYRFVIRCCRLCTNFNLQIYPYYHRPYNKL